MECGSTLVSESRRGCRSIREGVNKKYRKKNASESSVGITVIAPLSTASLRALCST